jgi:hypothetical protein
MSDEAPGLLAYVEQRLRAHHSPDLVVLKKSADATPLKSLEFAIYSIE